MSWETAKEIGARLFVHPATVLLWGRRKLIRSLKSAEHPKLFHVEQRPKFRHPGAKLTQEKVRALRTTRKSLSDRQRGDLFGVSRSTARNVRLGLLYKT